MPIRDDRPSPTPPGVIASWIGWAVGVVGSVVTVITAILAAKSALTAGYLLALFLTLILTYTWLIAYLLRRFSGNIRGFAGSLEKLQSEVKSAQDGQRVIGRALAVARDINDGVAELRTVPQEEQVITFSREASRQLARAFTDSLGHECRVCVKQVKASLGERPWAEAIARSDRSISADIGVKHFLDDNTDFSSLHRNEEKVWFCNDISSYPGYRTTSHMPRYRSTIVWPVLTRVADGAVTGKPFAPIVAFLCVDSNEPNAFIREEHVPLGWVVSDALARVYEAHRSWKDEGASVADAPAIEAQK